LLGNDALNLSAATNKLEIIEELLEVAFSVRSTPRLYGEGQRQFSSQSVSQSVSHAVRWWFHDSQSCERERGSATIYPTDGQSKSVLSYIFGSRYLAMTNEQTEDVCCNFSDL
jgi:hypothetical protein